MTRASIRECTEAVQERYLRASKKEKGKILDEFSKVVSCHRKAVIRLLRRRNQTGAGKKPGRPRQYGATVAGALRVVWEATDRLCSKRLHPFLPELVKILRRHGESTMTAEIEAQLCRMSPSTIDRLLRPWRRLGGRRPFSTTKPGSLLKSAIPIRTFADWEENCPGFLEADLVPHCGESAEGFYLNTLSAVDVASGWSECVGVWGKGQERVGGAIHHMRQRLPFPLLGLDSDNGSEFIKQHLYAYCQRERITFTRSHSYKKNDSCDVPVMKVVSKTRHGAKVHKVYDTARTPYQRLLESGVLTEAKQQELAATYHGLNPVFLLKQINENLECLWKLEERPAGQQKKVKTCEVSVT